MAINLTDPIFHNIEAARSWLENSRWPSGPICPHCETQNVLRLSGAGHRPGLFHCRECRGQFTVLTGSVMESSHIPLPKWVLAIRLMASSKKGVSTHQIHRSLGITYKSAWFLTHRLREAMADPKASPIGGEGKVIEADEAYHGKRETPAPRSRQAEHARPKYTKQGKGGGAQKRPIVALVERGGEARVTHMNHVTGANIHEFMARSVSFQSRLHTDESVLYPALGRQFVSHETVNHGAKEFARGDVTTNSAEGFFGIFKRGMIGVYQHCGEHHFQRYLDEFTFRYNNRVKLGMDDTQRAINITYSMNGKRLTYRRIAGQEEGYARWVY